MALKDDLEKISRVPDRDPATKTITPPDPTAFALGLAGALVKMMLSISFDPLKGKITIPGAEDFLTQTIGFGGVNAAPIIRQLSSTFDEENIPMLEALVNVSGQKTKYTFEVNEDRNFFKDFLMFTGVLDNAENTKISAAIIGNLKSSSKYFYRLKLENQNGTTISDIFILITKGSNPPRKGDINA